MTVEFHKCSGCLLADSYTLPGIVLENKISDARRQYLEPLARLLTGVKNGTDTLVTRRCSFGRNAFGSSLCARESEFEPKG